MKAIKLIAILVMLLAPFSVRAVCPTQETMVMYVNGVDVEDIDAKHSGERIEEEVTKEPGINSDCLHFDYIYNTNEPLFADWLEAAFQKADEFGQKPETFWRNWLRTVDGPVAFFFNSALDLLGTSSRTAIDAGQWVLGDQKAEHLARYEKELGPLNRRLILVPHSQGNFYANEEYAALTVLEKTKTHIVATATPSSFVADNGPWVSVNEDILVQTIFAAAGALSPNTPNLTERCQGTLASTNRWLCHGFKEEYMAAGKLSRSKIVNDIISLLPHTSAPPTILHQFFGTIVNDHYLQLTGFVPDSDSWILTRGDYDTTDDAAWNRAFCTAINGPSLGNLDWLTLEYAFVTNGNITGNFSTTGVDLNISQGGVNGNGVSCQAPGTWYLAVYDSHGDWTERVFKGVVVLNQIDATHWTTALQ